MLPSRSWPSVKIASRSTSGLDARAPDLLLWTRSGAQSDDRQFAIGFLLILRETVCRAGDVAPRLLAGVAMQLFGADRDGAPGGVNLHGLGVRGEVVVPGGVLGCPVRRRDDQPAVGPV